MTGDTFGGIIIGILFSVIIWSLITLSSYGNTSSSCLSEDVPRRWSSKSEICQEYVEGEWETIMEDGKMTYNEKAQRLVE